MTAYENLSSNQKVRASLHRDVLSICKETSHYLGLDITGQAVAVIAELVLRKVSVYGQDLEAFAKHAKRSVINQEDVKLLARRNSSLRERLNGLCKNIPSASKEKKRKTNQIQTLVTPESDPKKEDDEKQTKKQKATDELNTPILGVSEEPGIVDNVDTASKEKKRKIIQTLVTPESDAKKEDDEKQTKNQKATDELNTPILGVSEEPEPMDYVETIDLTT